MGGYYPGASDYAAAAAGRQRTAVRRSIRRWRTAVRRLSRRAQSQQQRQSTASSSKTTPRATGRATRVIITEYDLPRKEIQPHDVIVDPDGGVWFSHFGEQFLSKLDPKTGKVTDYPIPVLKPDHPKGTLDLEVDPDGNIWVGMMYQGGMARFDRKTEKFRIYPMPQEWQTDATQQSHFSVAGMKADGKVWVKNSDRSQVLKLDPETGVYENLGSFNIPETGRPIGIYGIYADSAEQRLHPRISATAASARSTPRPARSRSIRRRRRLRGRGAAASMRRTGCGSPNMAPMASACSIRRPRRSPNGEAARLGVALRRGGRPPWRGLGGQRVVRPPRPARSRRPASGSTIRCRATATSAASSSTTAARGSWCGPATTTPHR